eukprot:scaffold2418_cov58-Cyclotella_meneghiniana.AAC.21
MTIRDVKFGGPGSRVQGPGSRVQTLVNLPLPALPFQQDMRKDTPVTIQSTQQIIGGGRCVKDTPKKYLLYFISSMQQQTGSLPLPYVHRGCEREVTSTSHM